MKRNRLIGVVAIASTLLVAGHEGLRLKAYRDAAGIPTICNGVTRDVKIGDVATFEQCQSMLLTELKKHNTPFESLPIEIPDRVHIAALDWSYNVGVNATLNSTLYKYLKSGDWNQACNQFTQWRKVRINGVMRDCSLAEWRGKCGGVYDRRITERDLCSGKITIEQALNKLGMSMPDGAVND